MPQLSFIEMYFKQGTDELEARQLVTERMAAVVKIIPTWASPPVMMPPVSTTGRVVEVGLSSDTINLRDMSIIAYWTIRARLLRVPGVANVAIWGERLKMPQVLVDPARLSQADLTLDHVMTVTADALDSGILKFSNGAVIGPGGSSTRRPSVSRSSTRSRPHAAGPRPGHGGEASRQDADAR